MAGSISQSLFARATQSIPGGVNSPVRSFQAVGGAPLVASRGEGAYLIDVDGAQYLDCLMSWGALILGHAHPDVCEAVHDAIDRGLGFGLTTSVEAELAELIRDAFPSIERVRLVNSGTEAVMSAIRLARAFTGRDKIIKFEGGYHGHSDGLLAKAGSGLTTLGIPASAGVPASFAAETLLARYNDLSSVETICHAHRDRIAAILVEPVAGNMGVVPPAPGFLEGLRHLCDETSALLIFDEIITGFRIAWGGAQERYKIEADLTTLGKIIGGGLPVGAFGGREEIMRLLAPEGNVYQAGTLSGNPVTVSAGLAALTTLKRLNPYAELDRKGERIEKALRDAAGEAGIPLQVNRVGSMLAPFFNDEPITDYDSSQKIDAPRYAAFFRAMLEEGILLPPSPWEATFLSTAHDTHVIEEFVGAAETVLRNMRNAS